MLNETSCEEPIVFLVGAITNSGGSRVIVELVNSLHRRSVAVEVHFFTASGFASQNSFYQLEPGVPRKFVGSKISLRAGAGKLDILFQMSVCLIKVSLLGVRGRCMVISSPILSAVFWIARSRKVCDFHQADNNSIFDSKTEIPRIILRLYKFMTRMSYRFFRGPIFFNSDYVRNQFLAFGQYRPRLLIHPGIDPGTFNESQRSLPGPHRDSVSVGTIIRKQPSKGTADFIAVLPDIRREIPGVQIIGILPEPVSFSLEDFDLVVSPLGDEELSSTYQSIDVFVVSSHWEGFGMGGLEALACGCSLVTSRNGGCEIYFSDELDGRYFEAKDLVGMKKAIVDCCKSDHRAEALERSTRAHTFDWERTSREFLQCLQESGL
jgi:glycosyltransferase involved in cell wall biosynthesis